MSKKKFHEILTERLSLRRFQSDDAELVYAYRHTPELRKFLTWPPSREELHSTIVRLRSKEFCSTSGWDQLVIVRLSDNQILGDCAVRIDENDARIAELGIALAPEFQSKGYASETFNALFNFLFSNRGIHRACTHVDPRNHASMALMERLGMRKEGQIKQGRWFRDEWVDDVIYGMLAFEWTGPVA